MSGGVFVYEETEVLFKVWHILRHLATNLELLPSLRWPRGAKHNNRTSVKLFSVGPNSLPAVVSKPCREASPGLFQLDVFNCDIELHKTF